MGLMQIPTSFELFRVFGIPVRAHLSVGLLMLYLVFTVGNLFYGLLFALMLLGSILLHELSHTAAAVAFGGHVCDIRLQLMGGCAMITRMPPKPWHECVMALAGPACSLLLAALFWGLSWAFATEEPRVWRIGGNYFTDGSTVTVQHFWLGVAAMLNFGLGCFNLLPAYPMDGGRVLRSAMQMAGRTKVAATEIAVTVGQGFAVLWAAVSVLALLGISMQAPETWPEALRFGWDLLFGGGGLLLLAVAYMIWASGRRELAYARQEALYSRIYGGRS